MKQTVTHLFDAVRFSEHANELEESARNVEGELEAGLNRLDAETEELSNLLARMRGEKEDVTDELSRQVEGFLDTAKEQARGKLQKSTTQRLEEYRSAAASERDKALKSLEAYFASEPVSVAESVTQVRLSEGVYEARSRYECEGGIRYEFRLAAKNSRVFHEPFSLSQIGYELRVPVRFSRALLSKTRTPGFERLDQYVLVAAESSGGRLRANFEKPGNGAKFKIVTSGSEEDGFLGVEYTDQLEAVNVMNDPSLVAFVDIEGLKKAAKDLVNELAELSKSKVALLRLSVNGEQSLQDVNCREVLQKVMGVMGPAYKASIKRILSGSVTEEGDDLNLDFLKSRIRILGGDLSSSVSQSLGLAVP